MRHRHAILAALALSAVIALMFAGRARAAGSPPWAPNPGDTWLRIELTAGRDLLTS
jgi:hypothetical protein